MFECLKVQKNEVSIAEEIKKALIILPALFSITFSFRKTSVQFFYEQVLPFAEIYR